MTQASCHGPAALHDPIPTRPQLVLAGNPNVGKTTLFNALTGSSAKVSNYPGITVEAACGALTLPGGRIADLRDLPGTYSVNARSAEEQIALDALVGLDGAAAPDAVIVCVDATQVARAAYLLLQCQELGARCVVALTMVDEAGAAAPDPRALAGVLGCEVVAVTARTRAGLDELRAAIDRALRAERRGVWHWQPGRELRARIDAVAGALPTAWRSATRYGAALPASDDALALWALTCVEPRTGGADDDELDVPDAVRAAVVAEPAPRDDEAVLARWAWLDKEIPPLVSRPPDRTLTQRIDRILLHRVVGFASFIAVMSVLFMSLFWWASPVMDAIDQLFKGGGERLAGVLGEGVFTDFLVQGVIGGVGAVMVFLPQILLLFLFLGFLEDCGYLARVAYLMDRIMRSMNLHGRAFVPMLSGFACAVPAVMATRTMERKRDRILTMMVVPLMTCSARLPVYTLVIGALIPGSRWTQGLLMVGMYLFSVVTALIAAWVLSRTVKPLRAKRLPFVIELPPYRWPRLGGVVRMMWGKSSMFLREAGTVILACSIALWALLYFPHHVPAGSPDYDAMAEHAPSDDARQAVLAEKQATQLANSYGGRVGHAIEPAIQPLGFDWKIGVGIIGAFAAREVFVSTLGIVYAVGSDADSRSEPLRQALRDARDSHGAQAYTPLVGMSLMIFFALACQCMSTLAVVRRETASLRWPLFLFGYMGVLAWVTSFCVFQLGKLLGLG
ncbi:MAG TPA: ferrous iron transport protein B [Kofleriaceae bacterium]|jgi:ferrous iron transport protein B|nr:ferrous iron transport protein B [Kofleriaceae bacterium]